LPKWTHFMHTQPLLDFLTRELDYDAIAESKMEVRVAAVDIGTGDLRVFTNQEITPKRLLASSSLPLLFPMVEDAGRHYWDGGTVVNTPLQPAIEAGADDITTILLSPVGARDLPPPKHMWDAIARFHDLRQLGNLKEDLKHAEFINGLVAAGTADPAWHHIDFHIVSPKETMGLMTILNFDPRLATRLIAMGEKDGLEFIETGLLDHRVEVQARVEIKEAEVREARTWDDLF
ncbi:MAG: patatin-like phospholipase family protein, partial [Candidatus Thermoplasmatota archaeon]